MIGDYKMGHDSRNILDYDTVNLNKNNNSLEIIDQTKLPGNIEIINLTKAEEMWDAIYLLKVRGAPAIGVAAAIGIYVLASKFEYRDKEDFFDQFEKSKNYLNSSRPTAVNLSWALNRMDKLCRDNSVKNVPEIIQLLKEEALKIRQEDIDVCRSIGEYGLTLVHKNDGLLTHCNAGQLATVKYGTATAPMYLGFERGYSFRIYCDETRPLLQGARLTSFELSSAGMDVTLLCDNMSASLMKKGLVDAVFVGCDRVAANGDAANKIGTLGVSIIANHFNVPVYICAPTSTIDMNTHTGDDIVIEQRKPEEVTKMWYKEKMAPENINVYNPAFDVTDHELITAIVTEHGIIYPPFEENFKKILLCKQQGPGK